MNRIKKVLEHIENDSIDLENVDDISIVQIYSNIVYEKINSCTTRDILIIVLFITSVLY